jgi:hypothetical protein
MMYKEGQVKTAGQRCPVGDSATEKNQGNKGKWHFKESDSEKTLGVRRKSCEPYL